MIDDPFAGGVVTDADPFAGGVLSPMFPTDMYDDIPYSEAAETYKNILFEKDEDGEFTGKLNTNVDKGLLNYSYKDEQTGKTTLIPFPQTSFIGSVKRLFGGDPEATVTPSQILSLGAQESMSDFAEADAAFLDIVGAAPAVKAAGTAVGLDMPGDETSLIENRQKKSVNADTGSSFWDAILADAGPAIAVGVPTGMGTVGLLSKVPMTAYKSANFVINTFKGLAATLAGETAATLTTGTDEGTLVLGDKATFPAFPDIVDLGDTDADKVIEHRLNTLTEGMSLGGVILGTVATAKAVGTTAGQFLLGGFVNMIKGPERAVYMQLSAELANLPPNANERMLADARQRIAEIVAENKDVLVNSIRGMENNETVTIDTIGALLKGMDSSADQANVSAIRAGEMQTPGSPIPARVDAPIAAVQQDLAAEAAELGGGDAAAQTAKMQEGAEGVVEQARVSFDDVGKGAGQAQAEYDNAFEAVMKGFENDIELTSVLDELARREGLDLVGPITENKDQIKKLLEAAYRKQKSEKNLKYATVSGGPVDADAIIDQFQRIDLGAITQADYLLKSNRPVGTIHKLVQPKKVPDEAGEEGAMRLEEPAETLNRVQDYLDNNALNFGFFYKQVRTELTQLAGDLFAPGGNRAAGTEVRNFIRFIDNDMLDFVEEAGDAGLAANAREAKRFFTEDYLFKSGGQNPTKLAEYARLFDDTLGRTDRDDITAPLRNEGFNRPGYESGLENMTNSWLEQGNRFDVRDLKSALTSLDGQKGGEIADYYVLKVLGKFAIDAQTGGINSVDYKTITNEMLKYAEVLNQNFPEKAATITGFLTRLRNAGDSQEALLKILEGTKASADKGIEQLQGSVLVDFFDKTLTPRLKDLGSSAEIVATSDPYRVFSSFFTGAEPVSRTRQLLDLIGQAPAGQRPVILDSLKLSYVKFLNDKLIGRKLQTSGATPMNSAAIERAQEELTPLFRVGREIYGEDGGVLFSGLEQSLGMAKEIDAVKGATPVASQSATSYNIQARTNTNRAIAIFIGPLSRLGTKIRSVLGGVVEKRDPDARAKVIRQQLLAYPDQYIALAKKYNSDPSDPLLEESLYYFLASGMIKTDLDTDIEDVPGFIEDGRGVVDDAAEAANAVFQ